MFYRQSRDTFIRSIGDYGYIFSQLTKHDRTYTQEGRAFLEALSREPQSLETLAAKACEYFEGVSPVDIQGDMQEFYDSLVADRYLVCGNTAEECASKDTHFSYAENPKTLFTYNAQQNPDDEKLYADTQEVLGDYYREHPQIHSCQIETTNRCNERCIHCYIPHELKNVVLPYEVIESVLLQLHDLGVMGLTLSGGEFFTHPDAEKILRKARELDFSFYVLSNITLITPHMIDVLKEVDAEEDPLIVFTTAYDEYALKAFAEYTIDYLLKPIEEERLQVCMDKVRRLGGILGGSVDTEEDMQRLLNRSPSDQQTYLRRIQAKIGDRTIVIPIENIFRFQSEEKYTTVYASNGKFIISTPLIELEKRLDPAQFVRVHRAHLIAIDAITEYQRLPNGHFTIKLHDKDHSVIPVSRNFVSNLHSL